MKHSLQTLHTAVAVSLASCIAAPAAYGQATTVAPTAHGPAHPRHTPAKTVHHAPHGKVAKVPVVHPRHAGPPRHAIHGQAPGSVTGATTKTPPPKPAAEKQEPPKVVAPKPPALPKKPPVPSDVGTNTGLKLPRYAALKTDDANMRSGPGERYPIVWQYRRRDLPVKIEREFDVWRLVEDMDGIKGWVHQATLTGRRDFITTGQDDRTIRSEASETASPVAVLKAGVIGKLRACDAQAAWCQVQVQDYRGWLKRSDFWGIDTNEAVQP